MRKTLIATVLSAAALSTGGVLAAAPANADGPTRYYSETVSGQTPDLCEAAAQTRVQQLQSQGWYVTYVGCYRETFAFDWTGNISYS
ncbi:MAG: hypothetical protein Q7T56_00540 [Nocardioidaceae bacterium]|nr:hypothetical protein [Nocardioidaceae bacterium]